MSQAPPNKAEMHIDYSDNKGIKALTAVEEDSTVIPTLDLDDKYDKYDLNFHYATLTMNETS